MTVRFKTVIQSTGMLQLLLRCRAERLSLPLLLHWTKIAPERCAFRIASVLQVHQPYTMNLTTMSRDGLYLLPSCRSRMMRFIYA